MMGEEYLRELAAEIGHPDETHVDMSLLKNQVCHGLEYEELKIEQDEEVEIPPE